MEPVEQQKNAFRMGKQLDPRDKSVRAFLDEQRIDERAGVFVSGAPVDRSAMVFFGGIPLHKSARDFGVEVD